MKRLKKMENNNEKFEIFREIDRIKMDNEVFAATLDKLKKDLSEELGKRTVSQLCEQPPKVKFSLIKRLTKRMSKLFGFS